MQGGDDELDAVRGESQADAGVNIWDNVLCSVVNRGCGQPGLKIARGREPFLPPLVSRYQFPFAGAFSFLTSAEGFIVSSEEFYWVNPERSGGSEL